jgi:hypothetical protein
MDRVHAERAFVYRGVLEPDEVIHNTGIAALLKTREQRGRAVLGEGVLLVTSARLVWVSDDVPVLIEELKTAFRNVEQHPCPRSWHGSSLRMRRRERRQMQQLHMEVGGNDVDFVGGALFFDEVVGHLRGEPPALLVSARRVVWGEDGDTGSMVAVVERVGGNPTFLSRIVPAPLAGSGDPQTQQILENSYDMITDQAFGELRVSLGLEPKVGYEWPRPIWMPEFHWDPPLPDQQTEVT